MTNYPRTHDSNTVSISRKRDHDDEIITINGGEIRCNIKTAYQVWPQTDVFQDRYPKTWRAIADVCANKAAGSVTVKYTDGITIRVISGPTHVSRWGEFVFTRDGVEATVGVYDSVIRARLSQYASEDPIAELSYSVLKDTLIDDVVQRVVDSFEGDLVAHERLQFNGMAQLFAKLHKLDLRAVWIGGKLDAHAKAVIPEMFKEFVREAKDE